jgi:hypothetical protein
MDLIDALTILIDYYQGPVTAQEIAAEVHGELSHDSIHQDVIAGEITDARVALAFHVVIGAHEATLQDAVEELSCWAAL